MARNDELRLIAKVAHLYYGRGARQAEIARQLDLSQATVSRLLKRAEAAPAGISACASSIGKASRC